ncbi:hypothetical protein E8E13_001820 [Curvularia kusanoi]|uniref:Uncharacterized protein n=1 Tax=Curvularia kusanoi TaxID=90978 RepID=A0A9P4T6D3_CURKU|nr:hypothetical protein E8E13_001820 [Curvularia kusanoi]
MLLPHPQASSLKITGPFSTVIIMLYSTLLVSALAALSTSVAAAPSPAADFSFAQWIEDIIADPNGSHLSPAEAVKAKDAAVAAASPLQKRANCDHDWARANANDASACLSDLARKGAAGTQCALQQYQFSAQMCRIGNAQVVGSKGEAKAESVSCSDVARTGGKIFDSCWRSDNTIMGSEHVKDNFQINILRL